MALCTRHGATAFISFERDTDACVRLYLARLELDIGKRGRELPESVLVV